MKYALAAIQTFGLKSKRFFRILWSSVFVAILTMLIKHNHIKPCWECVYISFEYRAQNLRMSCCDLIPGHGTQSLVLVVHATLACPIKMSMISRETERYVVYSCHCHAYLHHSRVLTCMALFSNVARMAEWIRNELGTNTRMDLKIWRASFWGGFSIIFAEKGLWDTVFLVRASQIRVHLTRQIPMCKFKCSKSKCYDIPITTASISCESMIS